MRCSAGCGPGRCWTACAAPQPPTSSRVVDAVLALSTLAVELGDALAALDVNPLLCGPAGAVAVDALVLPR